MEAILGCDLNKLEADFYALAPTPVETIFTDTIYNFTISDLFIGDTFSFDELGLKYTYLGEMINLFEKKYLYQHGKILYSTLENKSVFLFTL